MNAFGGDADFSAMLRPLLSFERIEMAVDCFGEDLVMTTSFGPTAAVLLHLAISVYPDIRVINIRHGHETERTLEIADLLITELRLNIRVYDAPRLPLPTNDGSELHSFQESVKVATMRRALKEELPQAWLSGLMAEETPERRDMGYAQRNEQLVKIYPLYDWRQIDAVNYCLDRGLPLNEDYFDPCKGRGQSLECGMHITNFSIPVS
jgi:3'-phosphoadenosine 5'-phosphosulfate sulfotransferase (PAPS reductase)/FAD synthetase